MANAAGLEVRESGRALRFHTEAPHLVSTGSGRLSTTVTLHPLPEGRIIVGSSPKADIQLGGSGVEFVHCIIENVAGSVTLHPLSGSTCVDGTQLATPLRLSQGCMLTIGRSNYLRFNHPAEAKQLKSALPGRISLSAMTFANNGCHEAAEQRKPPHAPRKSPRNSGCSDEEVNFLGKLTKFEMLARQARANCVSPKVFPSGSITTNVPADQILGHSRSSSLASLGRSSTSSPFQNLTNFDRCQVNDEQKQCSLPVTINRNYSQNQNAIYANVLPRSHSPNEQSHCARSWQQQLLHHQQQQHHNHHQRRPTSHELLDYSDGDENRNNVLPNGYSSNDLMTRSLSCERSCDLDQFSRDFDMSQSLIVAKKTTTTTEFLQLEKFGSNPVIPCHRRAGSCDSQNFGSQSSVRRIQPPSPAYNREPTYSDSRSLYGRIKSPSPSPAQSINRSCTSPTPNDHQQQKQQQQQQKQQQQQQAAETRARDQELEEILAMCVEYERQSSRALEQNRSTGASTTPTMTTTTTTNGVARSACTSPEQRWFEPAGGRVSPPTYENVGPAEPQAATPNNNQAPSSWPEQNGYASPRNYSQQPEQQQDSRNSSYEEIESLNGRASAHEMRPANTDLTNGTAANSTSDAPSPPLPDKTVKLVAHNYENFVPRNGNVSVYENIGPALSSHAQSKSNGGSSYNNNNTISSNNNGMPSKPSLPKPRRRPSRDTCELIDNKLDVSNDDLLEAIEQLSLLSKPRHSGGLADSPVLTTPVATPKRINSEHDNAKSNEVKADKERRELEEEDRRKYIDFLQNEKQHILGNMDGFKRSVADIENQEEEINRELELEKALLSAEHESESLKLEQEEAERERAQTLVAELETELAASNAVQAKLQAEARQRVSTAQQTCAKLEEQLADARGRDDERDSQLADRLAAQAEILETEKKAFEDLEFHHLEEEASRLATREELQRSIGELTTKIENRKKTLSQLEAQRTEIKNAVTKEAKSLERQKLAHLRRLEEGRNRLRAIDDELEGLAKNVGRDNADDKRSPSREDFDRISRVTNDSPIVNNQGSLGRKTIESLKEIERNRQLHLAKQGSQVISEERRRVEELQRRVQDEVRSQWEERKMNCTSFNSVESGEESSSYSTGPTESGSGSSDGADNGTGEKLSPGKLTEFTAPSPGPSGNSYTLLQSENARDDRPTSMETERFNGSGSGIVDETESRPLSQTSSELDSISPLQVKHRDKPKLQRPLTRYLPIRSESLDLRHHIETAGHHLPLIHDITVDTTTCSGYLSKMSKKFHHWNKRWFVFDRKRKTLSYYSDNNSRKPRGVIYFQSIEDVYVDHLNTIKSPQPSLTFIVKTTTRLYHFMAPSAEAMRVWVDVVITGAEGYHEFDPNS